ncbi:MAG: insulinase family protein [Firmicutes bacterium]|nr:insulinase family protein [Bacillota bacterium]
MREVKGYTVLREEDLPDFACRGTLLTHDKSGAQIVCMENPSDANKVFAVSFITPPADDSGIPHILEHSVLCGSRRFPIQDPFIELAKGSVNTYLNALTYSDHTTYPVASTNEKDLRNLMEVYLDAVFHPNILTDPRIMMQEGWHYEMASLQDPITVKGVVYNEMKGDFSSPDSLMGAEVAKLLFPDTPYGKESGGRPEAIPTLQRETFLDFYNQYYHPSNSRIYLYGDMDMAETLAWIDNEFLREFDRRDGYSRENLLPEQKLFDELRTAEIPYSVSAEQEDSDEEGYFTYATVVHPRNALESVGLQILDSILLEDEGAPLKEAILKAGFAKEVYGSYQSRLFQTVFSISAKGVDAADAERFRSLVDKTINKIRKEGITPEQKLAAINSMEFYIRERDFGMTPAGMVLLGNLMDAWMFGEDVFTFFHADDIFKGLREGAENGFFEDLLDRYLLSSRHWAFVTMRPEKDLAMKQDEALAESLRIYKDSLTDAEKEQLVRQTQELLAYQAKQGEEDTEHPVPHLSVSDLNPKAERIDAEETTIPCGRPTIYVAAETSGIMYERVYFDISGISRETVLYASLLSGLWGFLSTDRYTYQQLDQQFRIHTGGLRIAPQIMEKRDGTWWPEITVAFKYKQEEAETARELVLEILLHTHFDEWERLEELLDSEYSMMQNSIIQSGHRFAARRAMSGLKEASAYSQYLYGLEYLRFVQSAVHDFDEKKEEIAAGLKQAAQLIVSQAAVSFSGGCPLSLRDELLRQQDLLARALPDKPAVADDGAFRPETVQVNEALETPGQVQFVVQAGRYPGDFIGHMTVASQILGLGFLWNRLRVQGGAYGAFMTFDDSGTLTCSSYRDPNLASTLDVYKEIPDYLENFDCSDEDMEKYIIGTIGMLDIPMTPSMRIGSGISRTRAGKKYENIQKARDQILTTTKEDIRALAPRVREALKNGCICVVGSRNAIEKERDRFDSVCEVF